MTPTRTDAPGVDAATRAGRSGTPPDEGDAEGAHRSTPHPSTPAGCTSGELALAWTMVGAVVLTAAYVMIRPGPTPFDRWALARLPDRHHLGALVTATRLGSPVVLAAGAGAAFLATLRHHVARATAMLVGPALAVVVSDWLLKPVVGRTFEAVLSFPSGTTAAVSALATVAVLAVPSAARGAMLTVATALTMATAVAVVALGWHYPSDALGGIGTGVGAVLVADTTLCRVAARLGPARPGAATRAQDSPRR